MRRLIAFTALTLSVALCARVSAQPDLAGNDWTISFNALLSHPTMNAALGGPVPLNLSGLNSLSQSGSNLTLNFGPFPLNGSVTGSGLGAAISVSNTFAGPVVLPGSVVGLPDFISITIEGITFNLAGTLTGYNPPNDPNFPGNRGWRIAGAPSNITGPANNPSLANQDPNSSWGVFQTVTVRGAGQLGLPDEIVLNNFEFLITEWGALRPVPEPASLLALGAGLAGLMGLRRRK